MPTVLKQQSPMDAQRARQFYDDLDPRHRPRNMKHDAMNVPGWLSYELEEGSYPRSVEAVLEAAEDVWDDDGKQEEPLPIDARGYCDYVSTVAEKGKYLPYQRALAYILEHADELTPVHQYHGDMTLSNCVHTWDDRIVFIDPGHHRGLPCRELDEAKILQSLDGFDMLRYGWPLRAQKPTDWPKIVVKPVHCAVLVTHYVRLIPHMRAKNRQVLVDFATRRIGELDAWLK